MRNQATAPTEEHSEEEKKEIAFKEEAKRYWNHIMRLHLRGIQPRKSPSHLAWGKARKGTIALLEKKNSIFLRFSLDSPGATVGFHCNQK
jgi:hypothetical protein